MQTIHEQTQHLEKAQAAFLNRVAPGYRTKKVKWSGGNTQVIELGQGDPLLLIHGGMGEALQWGNLLPGLAKKYRVIAVDRPGHGLADAFDYTGVDLLSHASHFIKEIMDALHLTKVTLTGSSMGGLWATAFALSYPERLTSLLLIGAPAGITRSQPMMMRLGTLPLLRIPLRRMMRRPTRESTYNFWKQMMVAHPGKLAEDFLDALTASQARNAPNWFTLIDRTVDIRGMKKDLIIGQRWADLSVPVTFIWGEKDVWASPDTGRAVAAVNPNMKVISIPDAGHAPWIDAPELVLKAMLN